MASDGSLYHSSPCSSIAVRSSIIDWLGSAAHHRHLLSNLLNAQQNWRQIFSPVLYVAMSEKVIGIIFHVEERQRRENLVLLAAS